MPEKFVVIDGSSLVHRAFYALPLSMQTAAGFYTNAAYGFTTMLMRLLADSKPAAIAVAFDKGRVTFRNDTYAQYKGQRKATPPELSEQFPLVREIAQAFGIPVLEQAGYEADDIIGTLATQAAAAGYEVLIVTGDRDAFQLIGPMVKVLLTRKGITEVETVDVQALHEKYGVTPEQFIDLKGLMGDASDNIPGIPGVGEKTAVKLIGEFSSMENLLAHTEQVSGQKLRQKIIDNAELARMSKQLATIVRDMPGVEFEPAGFQMKPDLEKLRELFLKYEFKSLLVKLGELFPETAPVMMSETAVLTAPQSITDPDMLARLAEQCKEGKTAAVYPQFAGSTPDLTFLGAAIAVEGSEPVYVPAGDDRDKWFLSLLAEEAVCKIVYDAKPLYNYCFQYNQPLRNLAFDAVIAAYLADPTAAEYPLTALALRYLGQAAPWEEKTVRHEPGFAAWGAKTLLALQPLQEQALQSAGLEPLYRSIELPLTEVLASMETAGIRVDPMRLQEMSQETAGKLEELLNEIYALAGETFNVNSTRQLGVILFEKLHLPVLKKTKTGYSTDAEVLEKLAGQHPLIDRLLEYRMLMKLKSTYLDGLGGLVHPRTGRIHTSFNQTVTATGRLSSSDPNLQNIPVRSELGRKIRELFLPGTGYKYIVSADYSQIELRVLAHMSNDANLIEAFRENQDIHTRTASQVFGVPAEEVTAAMRSRAKAVNFGIVYGISDYGLSRDIGVSRKEAGIYIANYFAKYHGVREYVDSLIAQARQAGFVTTLFGRRRYLPDINSGNFNQRSFAERTAMNTPIQGTAADVIKKAMLDVYKALKQCKLKSRILLQVHDELVLEVPAEELETVLQLVREAMENTAPMTVPLLVETKFGENWAQAK